MSGMAAIVLLDLNLEALTRNATNADGVERSVAEIVDAVRQWGLQRRADGLWLCEPIDLKYFDPSEIVASWEVSDPGIHRDALG